MRRLQLGILTTVLVTSWMAPFAQAQVNGGGESTYPQTNAESRAAAEALAARPTEVVKITRNSTLGGVVARGRRVAVHDGGNRPTAAEAFTCEYSVGFQIEIVEGSRQFTVSPRPDCTMVLDAVTDINVVEPQDPVAQIAHRGPRGSFGNLLASLWQTFFPRLLAATLWTQRSVYHHIFTCGAACGDPSTGNGTDGLTALQSFVYYSQTENCEDLNCPSSRAVKLNGGTFEWWCLAGQYWNYEQGRWHSNCHYPMDQPGAPMVNVNTGWRAYNQWILVREWGPSGIRVRAAAQLEADWNPNGPTVQPRSYQHRLVVDTIGRVSPYSPICTSWYEGSIVNGPVKSLGGGCWVPSPWPCAGCQAVNDTETPWGKEVESHRG